MCWIFALVPTAFVSKGVLGHSGEWVDDGQGCCWNPQDSDRPCPIHDGPVDETGQAGWQKCADICNSDCSCGMFLYFSGTGYCTTYPYTGACKHPLKDGPTDCGSSGQQAHTYHKVSFPEPMPYYPTKKGYCLADGNDLPTLDGCMTVEEAQKRCDLYYDAKTSENCAAFWYDTPCQDSSKCPAPEHLRYDNASQFQGVCVGDSEGVHIGDSDADWVDDGQGCCWNPQDSDRPCPIHDGPVDETGSAGWQKCADICNSDCSCGMFLYFSGAGYCTTYPYKGECNHPLKDGPTDCGSSGKRAHTYHKSVDPTKKYCMQFKSQVHLVPAGTQDCPKPQSMLLTSSDDQVITPHFVQTVFNYALNHYVEGSAPKKEPQQGTYSYQDAAKTCMNDIECNGYFYECPKGMCLPNFPGRYPPSATYTFTVKGNDGLNKGGGHSAWTKQEEQPKQQNDLLVV